MLRPCSACAAAPRTRPSRADPGGHRPAPPAHARPAQAPSRPSRPLGLTLLVLRALGVAGRGRARRLRLARHPSRVCAPSLRARRTAARASPSSGWSCCSSWPSSAGSGSAWAIGRRRHRDPGLVNITKLDLRNDPVYPSDVVFLRQPGFLVEMVSPPGAGRGRRAGARCCSSAPAVGWLVGKVAAPPDARAPRAAACSVLRATRGVVVLVCLGLLYVAGNFNEQGNPWRAAFDSTGMRWRPWDQRVNYQRTASSPGCCSTCTSTRWPSRDGYSKAARRGDRRALPRRGRRR